MPARKKAKKKKEAKTKTKKRGLSIQRVCFCREYLVDFNATKAAERAKYSRKTAYSQGQRLLKNVEVRKRLQELIQKQAVRTQVEADQIVKEAARVALADVGLAFKKDGTFKNIHNIPKDLRRAISGIEVIETFTGTGENRIWTGYIKKIKFWSKDKNIETLMKHLGLFQKEKEQAGQTLASAVHEAMKDKE